MSVLVTVGALALARAVGDERLQQARWPSQPGDQRLAPDRRAPEAPPRPDRESRQYREGRGGVRARHARSRHRRAQPRREPHRGRRTPAARRANCRRRSGDSSRSPKTILSSPPTRTCGRCRKNSPAPRTRSAPRVSLQQRRDEVQHRHRGDSRQHHRRVRRLQGGRTLRDHGRRRACGAVGERVGDKGLTRGGEDGLGSWVLRLGS